MSYFEPQLSAEEYDYALTNRTCFCGSRLPKSRHYDARGIFLCYACDKCWPERKKNYRPDVLDDPDYWHDEPIEED